MEHISDHPDEGFVEEEGDMEISRDRNTYSFNWTVNTGMRRKSGDIALTSGDTIAISGLIQPVDKTVQIGIMASDNSIHSYDVQGAFIESFVISISGNYRVFVQNGSGSTVTATFSAYVY